MQSSTMNGPVDVNGCQPQEEITRNDTVLDMRSIDPQYSKKMADDSRVHHLLTDIMFNPRRKWTKHRRHSLDDIENHPPFHHNLRLHLRHIVSEKKEKQAQKQRASKALVISNAIATGKTPHRVSFNIHTGEMDKDETDGNEKDKEGKESDSHGSSNSSDSEDMGIMFTARRGSLCDNSSMEISSPPIPEVKQNGETAVESSLPWKRETNRPPMSSSFTHSMPAEDQPKLAEVPSWVDNLDYSNQGNIIEFNDNDKYHEENNKDNMDSPLPLPWRSVPSEEPPVSSLPWRNQNNCEVEPVISPSASQVWSSRLPPSDLPSADNSTSKHSEPIIMHPVMDLPYFRTNGSLDMEIPAQNLLFDHGSISGDDNECHHRRRPSFFRNRSIDRGRRPSIQLPLDTQDEGDRLERIRSWLRSSHPENLATPPADIFNVDFPGQSHVNPTDMETSL